MTMRLASAALPAAYRTVALPCSIMNSRSRGSTYDVGEQLQHYFNEIDECLARALAHISQRLVDVCYPLKAEINWIDWNVRFWHKANMCSLGNRYPITARAARRNCGRFDQSRDCSLISQ